MGAMNQSEAEKIMLAPHFSLWEFVRSEKATQHGIENWPPAKFMANLHRTARTLEAIRGELLSGSPIHVSSGYRCPRLNALVGGSLTSDHLRGLAADFEVQTFHRTLCEKIRGRMREAKRRLGEGPGLPPGWEPGPWDIDQLIYEHGEGGWIHIGLGSGRPRYQTLSSTWRHGPGSEVIYTEGLQEAT